ncbi:tyrosine-type recombinase/integrase [Myxosarcina sp. GI1]|uniref:tyrosine-type recombinase/integrase n=1 Tax=Myxosarcina sp. GI1 TaxID=1541065 RepID=UPI00068E0FD5|nr:tyrosine-type recombinase/integrase [Myxosarcina sp. GI1]
MKALKSVSASSNLVPLLPRNRLAPDSGYETLLDDWLARSRSPHTKRMYRTNVTGFFQSLGYQLTPDLLAQFLLLDSQQAFELVSQYHGALVTQKLAPATINQKLAAIKSLVNYAAAAGKCHYTLTNIKAEKLTQYRDTKGIPKDQFKLMMKAVDTDTIKGLRDRAILLLLWGNALRRSEIANCDVSDFLPKAGELIITGKGKIGQPQTISLGKATIKAISLWMTARKDYTPSDPLFCAVHKGYWGNRLHTHSIYKLVQKYAKLAGIDKVMSPHRIRHSSITEALNLTNGDVRKVQKLSRHSNLNTLMIYDDNRQNLQGEVTGMLDDLF